METRMHSFPLGNEYNWEGLRVAVRWCHAHDSFSSSGPYSRTGNNLVGKGAIRSVMEADKNMDHFQPYFCVPRKTVA
jgi:hypothetical protein